MALHQHPMFRAFTRVMAVVVIGAGLSACSTVSSIVDPMGWFGPDSSDQAQATNGQYPDLASIPSRPQRAVSDNSAAVAGALVQARNDVQYSSQALRGGTEPAAAPPAPAPTQAQIAKAEELAAAHAPAKPGAAGAAPAPKRPAAAAAPAPAAAPEPQVAMASEPAPAPTAEPAVPAIRAYQPAPAQPAAPVQQAEAAIPGAMPAVAPAGPEGFEPSRAPPLDASVAQFVPGPIMNRYAQTGAVASGGRVALKAPSGMRRRVIGTSQTNVGGPESMGGAVVANFNSFQAGQPSVYTNAAGLRPVAVVRFRGASSQLSADARQTVNRAADAFMARGGIGYVRIVGHAARHTGKMSLVRRMELDFRRSQARARAVARALIHAGVPAKKVLIDAVGSSQPANDGSASNSQNANRRAEIFLQG